MKRLFKVSALAVLTVFFMTGCGMKAEYGITIEKNGNVNLEFIVAQDNELIDMEMGGSDSLNSTDDDDMVVTPYEGDFDDEDAINDWLNDDSDTTLSEKETTTHTDEERWKYIEEKESGDDGDFKDFKKVRYEKGEYKGYTYTLSLGKIENLVKSGDKVEIEKIGKDSKIFTKDGNTYKLNLTLSAKDLSEMKEYASTVDLDVKLKVTLPTKAKSNNATSVDGNTYTWDLTENSNIELAFELNNNNMILYCGIGAAVVLVVAIAIFCINKKSKNKNVPMNMNMNMPNNNMPNNNNNNNMPM